MKLKLVKPRTVVPPANPHGIDPAFYNPERDGVTQGLLQTFKNCREAARLSLLGWTDTRVGPSSIFGTVIHAALEIFYTQIQERKLTSLPKREDIKKVTLRIEKQWRAENPKAAPETLQALDMCILLANAILPVYFSYWHKDLTKVKWLSLEHQFKVPTTVFGWLNTFFRGKMDGRFNPDKDNRTWLLETKTKSRLGEQGESNLVDVLPRNIQVNMYLGAILAMENKTPGGVLYNIVRKPNLAPKKGESLPVFAARVAADVSKRPEHYFIRLKMSIDKKDLARELKKRDAVLEDFIKWFRGEAPHYDNDNHCENKYGTCGFLPICANGDFSRHAKRKTVFRELEDV
jgi:hypothetical protein